MPTSEPRLWVVSDTGSEPLVAGALAQEGWHSVSSAVFDPAIELTLASR
jgi:hypothetical protein